MVDIIPQMAHIIRALALLMNILQISDLHFGPRHWDGNDQFLLDKVNSFSADIILNTGDNTTDGHVDEYQRAGSFLRGLTCKNVVSTLGNHDKRNMRSHEFFRQYIDDTPIITIPGSTKTNKKNLFLDWEITKLNDIFTDINFVKPIGVSFFTRSRVVGSCKATTHIHEQHRTA